MTEHVLDGYEFPIMPTQEHYEEAYRKGMIRKEDLVTGCNYKGSSRNTSVAQWAGEYFVYEDARFGCLDELPYPTDEEWVDVFIPYERID